MEYNNEQRKWKLAIKKQFGRDWFINKNRLALKLRLKIVKRFLPKNKIVFLLDVGTGDGEMLYKLNNDKSFDIYAIGIELSYDILKVAKSLLRRAGEKTNINYINADADYLPLRNNIFNFITGTALIEHIPNVFLTVEEMKRVGSKHSKILLTTPSPLYYPIFKLLALLKLKFKENKFTNAQTLSNLKELFKKLKLRIIYASGFSAFSLILDKILSKISFCGYHFLINQIIIGEKEL